MGMKVAVIIHFFAFASAMNTSMDCYHHMDVGGASNACGFMPIVSIIAGHGQMKYDWYEGHFKTVPAEDIDSPEKCQAYCEKTPHCHYFGYESADHNGNPYADCTLKAGYPNATCTPLYESYNGSMTSGPKKCDSCAKHQQDVGGGFNSCGYMDNVVVYAKPNATRQSWYKGFYVELDEIHTWTKDVCQDLCTQNPDCDFWHLSEEHCYLKADYSPEQYANTTLGGCVPLYKPFDVIRPFNYSSGSKMCKDVSHSMSCGALKEHYKAAECCGMPHKMASMPK